MSHIHKRDPADPFPSNKLQFYRTSDHVLVYCNAYYDENTYLLIAIIKHWDWNKPSVIDDTDKDATLMAKIEKIAERFRDVTMPDINEPVVIKNKEKD